MIETFTSPDYRVALALPLIAGFAFYLYLCYEEKKQKGGKNENKQESLEFKQKQEKDSYGIYL